jgi:hypothetical protein
MSRATMADLIVETMKEEAEQEGTMKQHKFEVIRWLGQDWRKEPERFGVVEIDNAGPILRSGPLDKSAADAEARRLQHTAHVTETRRHRHGYH